MIDQQQFREFIVRPAIKDLQIWSPAAENLLVGTALVESRLTWVRQLPNGPALGFFQMEPGTHGDLWANYLRFNRAAQFRRIVLHHIGRRYPPPERLRLLIWDMKYAAMCCRLQYYRQPFKMPEADDIENLAVIYKRWWTTKRGKGTSAKFVELYEKYAKGPRS